MLKLYANIAMLLYFYGKIRYIGKHFFGNHHLCNSIHINDEAIKSRPKQSRELLDWLRPESIPSTSEIKTFSQQSQDSG